MNITQKIQNWLNQNTNKNTPENTYIPPVNAIDDADRSRYWDSYDVLRIKQIGKIKKQCL